MTLILLCTSAPMALVVTMDSVWRKCTSVMEMTTVEITVTKRIVVQV